MRAYCDVCMCMAGSTRPPEGRGSAALRSPRQELGSSGRGGEGGELRVGTNFRKDDEPHKKSFTGSAR
jgi:hypothetical protein